MRLIDADVLKKDLTRFYDGEVVARKLIDEQPTVDAVEVVRCKECRWRKDKSGSTAWMPCRALVTPDDFSCVIGERKEGGDNG